jgi:hypothetical protein
MKRGAARAALAAALAVGLAGCRLHVSRLDLNREITGESFEWVELGAHHRRDVLARLGAPDRAFYTRSELVFDYLAARHRGTDLRFFVPSDVMPGPIDPAAVLAVPRFFFDLFVEPEEFEPTTMERLARVGADAAVSAAPFVSGQDVVILRGRQIRVDQLRVVFDRSTLTATGKALRLASGEYQQQSLADQILPLR